MLQEDPDFDGVRFTMQQQPYIGWVVVMALAMVPAILAFLPLLPLLGEMVGVIVMLVGMLGWTGALIALALVSRPATVKVEPHRVLVEGASGHFGQRGRWELQTQSVTLEAQRHWSHTNGERLWRLELRDDAHAVVLHQLHLNELDVARIEAQVAEVRRLPREPVGSAAEVPGELAALQGAAARENE